MVHSARTRHADKESPEFSERMLDTEVSILMKVCGGVCGGCDGGVREEGGCARCEGSLELVSQVDHPNIIKLYECFDTKKEFMMVMEYVTGGELFDKIVERGSYSEKVRRGE